MSCRAVIDEGMICFSARTAAEIPKAFNGSDKPSKLPIPVEVSRPHGPRAHASQPTNGISIGSAVFCSAQERDQQTDRQTDTETDHATLCVAIA